MKSFHDKVAAITGAGSGIGRALALNLARQGCELALSDINEQGLAETVEQARRFEVKVSHQRVDVADFEAVRHWADQVMIDHGRVNLIINNAGVAQGGSVEGNALDDYHWIMDINFWGVVHGTKAFLPYLKASGAGHIVNVSSVFGLFAQPGMSATTPPSMRCAALPNRCARSWISPIAASPPVACIRVASVPTSHSAHA